MVVFLSKKLRYLLSVFKKKAGQKQDQQGKLSVHYIASQHYQENVFIEGNRPKHLEDLHIEAQEGLKILQQEVQNNELDFQDDHSISTATTQQEKDVNCLVEDGHLSFDSNADQSITSACTVSALSTRPVLTRQGSTFKPLNSVKRLDKTKKRGRRTTIMGIPQHVQKELCMGKEALLKQLPAGEDDGTVIIPVIDGGVSVTSHNGARVHLQDIEALQVFREEQLLKQQIQAVYRDDSLLTSKSGRQPFLMQRPKSLAVPELTTVSTFLQEPQGPVMSISPQATYLSTIIPNAILPSSIDVIEIDRNCHRRSVCTVNKNSLASASPGSSCSEGGTHDEPPSTTFKWSGSQSSDTIVSNPSTISFKGCEPPSNDVDKMKDVTDLNEERLSLKSSASWSSSTSKAARQRPEQGELSNAQLCSRNLSIIKAKLPPIPPPRRTCSSHHENLTQRPRKSANTTDIKYLGFNGGRKDEGLSEKEETSIYNENTSTCSPVSVFSDDAHSLTTSPFSPVQKSAYALKPNDSSPENKFERTMSPSSGYSSQSGTPTHSSKDICPSSPRRLKVKPPKPERISVRISPVVSVSSLVSITSTTSDQASHFIQTTAPQPSSVYLTVTTKNVLPPTSVATTFRELFDIPPPPKVKAPCPPPPETWAHNKCTTELLFGLNPNAHRPYELQKPCEKKSTHKLDERQAVVEHQLEEAKNVSSVVKEQVTLDKTPSNPLIQKTDDFLSQVHHQQQKLDQKSTVTSLTFAGNNNQKPQSPTKQLDSKLCHDGGNGLSESNNFTPKAEETYTHDQYLINHCTDRDLPNHKPTQTVTIEGPETIELSQSFSPPSEHPPLSSQKEELQSGITKELSILESSWPPPPPPMDESSDLVFEGHDEIDFPLPPPPVMHESFLENPDNCNKSSSGPKDNAIPEECTDVSDMVSNSEQNQKPQIIISTTVENIFKESTPKISEDKLLDQSDIKPQSAEDVSQAVTDTVCLKTSVLPKTSTLQNFQTSPQKITPEPQHDLSNPLTRAANDFSQQTMTESAATSSDVSPSSVLSAEDESTVNFRRQPNSASKDNKSKEPLSNYKSAPNSKEDANIPLVTPSLLQMVRLRSLNVEDQVALTQDSKAGTEPSPDPDQCVSNMVTPQKPIRKSVQLSIKSSSTIPAPSMCLQEAIRMKTAAMSSSGLSARPNLCLSTPTTNSNHDPVTSHKTPDDGDLHKSPASTASFIFSKSTKKVVIETPASPEAQAGLKQSLATELMQISDQTKSVVMNGTKKPVKIPPPIAKKPVCVPILSDKVGTVTALKMENSSSKQENGVANQQRTLQPAGQQAQSTGNQMLARRTETPRTFEVS
ncbi:NHS-like protein 3 isoform X2 [Trichomycterus rosablanca]|uniref:NHS-like protein 3 isoform X2 n=1 Tax=Trichomycterus rosablanca TaxID=2290929 RepID=UPI002F358B3E